MISTPAATPDATLPSALAVVDWWRRPESRVRARVAARRERMARVRGLEGRALREALVHDLVFEYALQSSALNGLAAMPFTLPGVGTLGTLAATVPLTVAADLALQTELVFALAAACDAPLQGEALRREAWRLVHFDGPRQIQEAAGDLARRILLKRAAEALLAQGVSRAICALLGHRAGPGVARTARIGVGWAFVPVVGTLAWRDMRALADRALAAFGAQPVPLDIQEEGVGHGR
jgi:hypothetical protein